MKLRTYPFALNRSMSAGISSADRFVFGPREFKGDTGIAVYEWEVSSSDACVAGLSKNREGLGSGRSPSFRRVLLDGPKKFPAHPQF